MKNTTFRFARPAMVLPMLAITVSLVSAGPAAPPPLPELNAKIVAFAREKLGKSVGDGSCTTLAIAALRAAGARYYPQMEAGGDYVWGQPVDSFKESLPGDILQFHNAVFQGKKALPRRRWTSWHHEYPHHTAIVSQVSEGGKVVTVLHQNVTGQGKDAGDAKNVRETMLPVDSLQKGGWVRIYRPVDPGR
jgi:hypothetical protein